MIYILDEAAGYLVPGETQYVDIFLRNSQRIDKKGNL